MEDNNSRVGEERIGGRGDDSVSGRANAGSPAASRTSASRGDSASRTDDPARRTREIKRDIERTRDDMSETVEAIQDRLRPGNIASNAVESVRSTASEKAREFTDAEPVQYVRANPIPTAMVGIGIAGLAWLAFGGREANRYGSRRYSGMRADWRSGTGYYEVDDEPGHSHTERFRHGGSAADYTPGMSYGDDANRPFGGRPFGDTRNVGTSRHSYGNTGRLGMDTGGMTNQVQRTWNENPLLMGAAAAVLGAIVGMAVPETERENQLMGEARDSMVEEVQHTVRDKVDQVQQAASNAVGQVQNAVGLTPEPAKAPGNTDRGRG